MFYTIRGLIEDKGVVLADTAYATCADEMLDFRIASGDFYEIPNLDEGLLRFKNTANVCSFDQLVDVLPGLGHIDLKKRDSYPFCSANLDLIAKGLESSPENVCVEGGPCLFGEHEVTGVVALSSGEVCQFDFSCGKRYTDTDLASYSSEYDADESDLASYICAHAGEITDVSFISHKTGLTRQEYLHTILPFAFAAALDVSLVITLPDMSYRKYLEYAVASLPDQMGRHVMDAFDKVLYGVSDLYLALIDRLTEHYRPRRLAVVHNRDRELVLAFEEARRPYIERNKVLRYLTGNAAKLESIKDYISMPALPLYLFGSRTILEVNSMDETDSYRKCRKAHKGAAEFGCILFPELLSSDEENTLYCAPIRYKDYGDYTYVLGWAAS